MPRWRPKSINTTKTVDTKVVEKNIKKRTKDLPYYAKSILDNNNTKDNENCTIDKIDKVLSWIELLAQSMSQQNESMNKMIEIMINSKPEPATIVDNTQTASEDKTTYTKNVPEVAQEIPYYDWMLELHDTWWVIPSNAVNIGTSKSPEHLKELFEKNYKGKSYQLNNWQKFFIKGFRVQRV